MAIQGDNVTAFIYESKDDDFNVSRIDFCKNQDSQLVDTSANVMSESKELDDLKQDNASENEKLLIYFFVLACIVLLQIVHFFRLAHDVSAGID